MSSFHKELEKIVGKNTVLAIDVFFVHNYNNVNTIKSFTYSEEKYQNFILPEFINVNGSIGGINVWKSEFSSYNENNKSEELQKRLIYKDDFDFDSAPKTNATFESFLDHLNKNNYGNHCFWNNVNQTVGNAQANISAIVIFNNEFKADIIHLKSIVYEVLMKDFYRLIINEFVGINEEQTKKIIKHQKDINFIKAHKHTIRNFGFENSLMNIDFALKHNKIDQAKKILKRVQKLNLLRDITIDFIYQTKAIKSSKNSLLLVDKLNQMGGQKYSKILKIINDAIPSSDDLLVIEENAESSKLNNIDEENIIAVFNLLVNLYSNTEKHSKNFSIKMYIFEGKLLIEFKNDSPIEDDSIVEAYVKKDIKCIKNIEDVGDGTKIIIDSLIKLNHSILVDRDKEQMKMTVTLKIE